jgi:hypothetical protein
MEPPLKVATSDDKALLHQNSSMPWPHEEIENTARFAFLGNVMVLEALTVGMAKTEASDAFRPCRVEIGIIRSAAFKESSALKKVAVRVVLYNPVN